MIGDHAEHGQFGSAHQACHEMILQMQEPMSLQERLDRFLRTIRMVLELDSAFVLLADPERQTLCVAASQGVEEPLETLRVPIGPEGGVIAQAFCGKQVVAWDGLSPLPESLRSPYDQMAALRSQIVALIPLVVVGRAIGVLTVHRTQRRRLFDPTTLERLQAFAALATLTIEHDRLYADLQAQVERHARRSREMSTLAMIASAVNDSLALNDILDQALDMTLAGLEMEAGEIFLLNAAHGEVYLVRHRGLEPEAFGERTCFALGEGIPGRVVQTGHPIIIPDLASDRRFLRPQVVAAGFRTFAALPLRAKGHIIGCFDLAGRRPHSFTADDLQLLTTIGAAIGLAVANGRMYEDLMRATKRPSVGADVPPNETVRRLSAQIRFLERRVEELEGKLEERKLIERAKGILMERLKLTEAEAMRRLQKESQHRNKRVVEIARIIVQAGTII